LQEARATFRALNAASPLATISFDPAGNVTTWNPSAETLLGWREYEVYGRPLPLMADETQAEFAAICARVLAKETVRDLQATCRRKDDTLCTVSLTAAPILDPAGEASGITLQLADVTVANALQTEFISTQRTLTLVSEIKKTLFCATGESELLQQVCEILVAHGGYVAAWAGLAHEENGQRVLRPQACSGLELPTLAQLLVAVDAPRQTHDPLEHAMRLGIVQTLSRLTKVALPQPWLAEAHAQNVGSLMIIPLLVNLKPIGVLVIYAAQPEAFDDAETERLSEFSDDLAYGIEALRIPLERQRAQEDLLRSARQWRSTFDAIIDPVCVVDADGIINRCNRAASQLLEKSFDAVLGTSVCSMLHDSLLPPATCALVRATECKETAVETVARGDNWYRVTIDPMLDEQGEVQGAVHIMTDITEQMQRAEELKQNNRRLQSILDETITAIAKIAEMRDPYTAGHERRVSELACAIARVMDMPLPRIEGLRVGGMLHDIGKLYVPAEILSKTGALTAMEFGVIKAHPQAGYEVLKSIDFPWPVAQMVLQHHERLDGTGYPNGLVGNDILPEACILAVADVVESMASHRPYRPARGLPAALDEIQQRAGQVYDPDVVNACVTVFAEGLCRFEA
ncbi:MAG TPA: HD domain-containing phosphohydrolase, partial [Armatimonadota bacterium]|jgi:PAS domain S-box-containing protein/putative nucleotidyltransferase with HDIG domain